MSVRPAIIPTLRYRDAPRAIDFLCDAFGFGRHAIYPDESDPAVIQHAQLVRAGQMVMVSTALPGEHIEAARMKTPEEAGGTTVALYVVLDDVDAHADRARAAGAKIIREPRDEDYGGRGYSALDQEGYAWSFGSYDPFA